MKKISDCLFLSLLVLWACENEPSKNEGEVKSVVSKDRSVKKEMGSMVFIEGGPFEMGVIVSKQMQTDIQSIRRKLIHSGWTFMRSLINSSLSSFPLQATKL